MALPVALGVLVSPLAPVAGAFRSLVQAVVNRRRLVEIGQMDDRMLRDIGLTRQDVWSVAAEPLFRDPTVGLAARADDTRMAAYAVARERQAVSELALRWSEESRAA